MLGTDNVYVTDFYLKEGVAVINRKVVDIIMNKPQNKPLSKPLSKLRMLPVNKTVVFYSPIEGDDVLVRTGTIGEGSCFLHSLLHACSREYVDMDMDGRMKFVRRLRASMAGGVDKENWEEIGGGLVAKIPFQENVNYILTNLYLFLAEDDRARGRSTRTVIKNLVGNDATQLELFRLVSELVPIEKFEQVILPKAYSRTENGKISDCRDAVLEETLDFLNSTQEMSSIDRTKADYVRGMTQKLVEEVLGEAEDSTFQDYINGLENVTEHIDTYTIGVISDRLERDIYFLDGKTRLPYNNCSTSENLKGRKSMIVLWIGDTHYEIVGRLLPGHRIQREFDAHDPLIRKLNTFLIQPEKVSEQYPELYPFLPKKYRVDAPLKNTPLGNPVSPSPSPSYSPSRSSSYVSSHPSDSEYESDYSRD